MNTGHVSVTASRSGGDLVIRVEDNGAGVPSDWRLSDSSGTGLANIRGRLDAMYAGRSAVEAAPRIGGGFGVTIRLPYTAA